jgi:hypothetical protein
VKAALIVVLLLTGCGSSPELQSKDAQTKDAQSKSEAVADHTALLPKQGLVSSRLVPDHLLGVARLPGGSLGEYDVKGKKYLLFIIEAATSQKAAFLLLDLKATLRTPEYLAYMGGYFGSDGARDILRVCKETVPRRSRRAQQSRCRPPRHRTRVAPELTPQALSTSS